MLHYQRSTLIISVVLSMICFSTPVFSRTVIQNIPSTTISEEYSDNYFTSENNKQEEFITTVAFGFSVGFLNKKSKIYLEYTPEFKKYQNLNNRDGFEHNVNLDGEFRLSKFTQLNAGFNYTTEDATLVGGSWDNSVYLSGTSQLTKNTLFSFSETYSQSFDEQQRTGRYLEHNVNKTSASISNQFGKRDRAGLNFSYEFDDYKNSDADEYTKYSPSAFITYWFTPLNGVDSNVAYESTDFDNSPDDSIDDIDTYSGHIRYLRKFSEHFDGYLKYRHTFSERDSGDHTIHHPSVGFDWQITDDSGISIGVGLLFSEWDNENSNSTDPFVDLDAYKIFNFSRRGSLAVTGSSGYDEAGEDEPSLGYTIYYRAGFQLNYKLQKRLTSYLNGSYQTDEFKEETVDRRDTTLEFGAGLS
ncbi:MAG: hypothetical protein ABFR31_03810, partial [Thermodesulfobacteriota bacterium]